MRRGYYIGLDVAMEVSVAYVVNEEGEVLGGHRFATREESFRGFLRGVPRPRHFVVEEGTQADWIVRIAKEECDKAVVCKPFKRGQLSGENKGDEEDAVNLAQKLRLNGIIEVWHDGGLRHKNLMQYALTYMTLVKECTREKNRMRSVFRGEGISVGQEIYESSKREKFIAQLPLEGERHRVRMYGEALDRLIELRKTTWSCFYKEVKKYALYKRLLKTPAFGQVSAALATAVIWEPTRFKNKRKFWAYSGFSLRTHNSGEYFIEKKTNRIVHKKKSLVLGLTREHNRTLKVIFKRAALTLARKEWKEEFQRLKSSGISKNNALLTLSRKVAAIAYHLAKNGGEYERDKVFVKQ